MFFNLKHHIVSLVAVFLALGLGILIGTALPGNEALVRQQQQLTASLERQLGALQQKNESLQARIGSLEMDNSILRQFESQIMPVLVAGKLTGHRIAVIDIPGCRSTGELAGMLETAGAGIQSITVLNGLETGDRSELLKKLNWPEMDERSFKTRMSREIAGAVLTGNTGTLNMLADGQVIKVLGQYGSPVDAVVIVGGGTVKIPSKTEGLDLSLIDCFKSRRINVYGVEESCTVSSKMREYQKKGITTVDNIDTVPGQVSLVYAMTGMPGRYGVKSSALKLSPFTDCGVPAGAR